MQTFIHALWNSLTPPQLDGLYRTLVRVTVLPGPQIKHDLRQFRAGTLEVLQNRSQSTVYRIRQTSVVYQQLKQAVSVFPTFNDFLDRLPTDELITEYRHKPPVYRLYSSDGQTHIERLKPPRFTAAYSPQFQLSGIHWTNGEPGQVQAAAAIKKAAMFLRANL